jgi:hypothetical protein
MGLTLAEHKAVTQTIATRYLGADRAGNGRFLGELCATTGWHLNHARKALKAALRPTIVKTRRPRPLTYDPKVVASPVFSWALFGIAGPIGKVGPA